jgi:hypothetical protein
MMNWNLLHLQLTVPQRSKQSRTSPVAVNVVAVVIWVCNWGSKTLFFVEDFFVTSHCEPVVKLRWVGVSHIRYLHIARQFADHSSSNMASRAGRSSCHEEQEFIDFLRNCRFEKKKTTRGSKWQPVTSSETADSKRKKPSEVRSGNPRILFFSKFHQK